MDEEYRTAWIEAEYIVVGWWEVAKKVVSGIDTSGVTIIEPGI